MGLKNRTMKTILAFILLSARVFNYSSFTAAFVVQPGAKDASCDTSLVKSAAKRRTVDIFNPVYRSNNPFYASCSSDDMSDGDEEKSLSVCALKDVGDSGPPCGRNQCCVLTKPRTPRCMAKGLSDGDSCFNTCQCGTGDESICQNRKCITIS